MRIAQLAPLAESVPPKGYGGTELVVSLLSDALQSAGHQVTLFASGDSKTKAELVAVTPKSLRQDSSIPTRRWPAYALKLLLEFEKRQDDFDIVHNHMGYEAFLTLRHCRIPSVTTNHNPIKDYCAPLYLAHKDLPFVSISHAYRRLNYGDILNYAATIYNGIDLDAFDATSNGSRSYLLYLGRICRDKGADTAIEIARKLAIPLIIAGKVDEAEGQFYEQVIKPQIVDSCHITYIGEVGPPEKRVLYRGARAVLNPIAFDEPFGLVMAEALASGTPVMAFARGSVPELISDGQTGILGKTADDLVRRFSELDLISPQECRHRAATLFSKERMLSEYVKLYESLCRK
jgi:glycosyltransferase involved in cell wall biosynthesis